MVLENSALPEFELKAWAFEHVDPHVASLDRALVPFRGLLHDPDASFSAELEAEVTEHVEELRGRLVLLGDPSLIAMAEQIRRVLAQGERLLRFANHSIWSRILMLLELVIPRQSVKMVT